MLNSRSVVQGRRGSRRPSCRARRSSESGVARNSTPAARIACTEATMSSVVSARCCTPGAAVELQVLVDLRLLLAHRRLVERELHLPRAVGDDLRHQRRVLGRDVVADELLHVREAEHPVVEADPLVHPAELDVADAVVDRRERRRPGGDDRVAADEARQEDAGVVVRCTNVCRVWPNVAMAAVTTLPCSSSLTAGVASEPGRAADIACSYAVSASGTVIARSTTPSPCSRTCAPTQVPACASPVIRNRADPASRTYSARSRRAGLRSPVCDAAHPERSGVVVRGLPGVAHANRT